MKKLIPLFGLLTLFSAISARALIPCDSCSCSSLCATACGGFGPGQTCANFICQLSPECGGGGCLTFEDVKSAFLSGLSPTEGLRPGYAASRLNARLSQYVESADLGAVYSGSTGFRVAKSAKLQAPDLAFIAEGRTGTPDLVARILPTAALARAAERDAASWLAMGAKAALVIDTDQETVTVYARDAKPWTLGTGDLLELPSIVPGWSLRVADLFP